MTAVAFPINELRRKLAQTPSRGQGAGGPEVAYRELIGFVPCCADGRGDGALESKLRGMHAQDIAEGRAGAIWDELHGVVRLLVLLHGLPGANRGNECLTALAEREREDGIAGRDNVRMCRLRSSPHTETFSQSQR